VIKIVHQIRTPTFDADPDPAFLDNADPDANPGKKTHLFIGHHEKNFFQLIK